MPSNRLEDEEDYFKDPPMKKKAKAPAPVSRVADTTMPAGLRPSKAVARSKVEVETRKASIKPRVSANPVTRRETDTRDHIQAVEQFIDRLQGNLNPVFIGIDPGFRGGIALIHPTNSEYHDAVDIPTLTIDSGSKTKKGNKSKRQIYDNAVLWEMFKLIKSHNSHITICLEKMQPMPVDTPLTSFSLGAAHAMWPLFFYSHGIAYEEISPSAWKGIMGLHGKDKSHSRMLAQKLFPNAPLFRVKDDGRAEAFLVAEAIKRKRNAAILDA